MTEREYRAADGINKSTLWEMRRSPAHYKYSLENPPEDTPALRFGRALHSAILTPSAFKREVVVAPEINQRTKAGKEEYAAWLSSVPADATILTPAEMQTLKDMVNAYKGSSEARALLKGSKREVPLFWNDRELGLKCKCRVDAITPEAIIDIKTTTDASTDAFRRDALKYGYHVQAAHYLEAAMAKRGKLPDWYFIAIEKKPPYGVHVMKAEPGFIDYGAFERIRLLEKVKDCMESDTWPSYQQGSIEIPDWVYGEEED